MTKIKLCGLRRACDIEYANTLMPDYTGFIFAKNSKRYVEPQKAAMLRKQLKKGIIPVGVFADEKIENIMDFFNRRIIEVVQLHGNEDEEYIQKLQERVQCTIIKAFYIKSRADIIKANHSSADYVLLDSGGGSGECFDWSVLEAIKRPYFLAGGLSASNVKTAIESLHPYAVDASSSLETDGYKDIEKMTAFVQAVRESEA
ncbi:MAG: phosphoribosylanthranilate isomerase [Lachnospiraceae bacterium]|nr:phosphoribosylanthranilate isomerase [Lachnospiraceae bacterium]